MTSAMAPSISCLIVRYCACKSTKGIFMGRNQRSEIRTQCLAALEGTKKARGIPRINSGNAYILGNDCAGSNDHLIANRHWEDRSACSDTYTFSKFGRPPELRIFRRSAGAEQVVNKHRAMRNEAVIANGDEIADECVRLNPASFADSHSLLYLYKWADETVVSNRAPIEIDRRHHGDVFTEGYIDNPCVADFWLCHETLA